MFFKQENDYDCGPCMILNLLNHLGSIHDFKSPRDVRKKINGLRKKEGKSLQEDTAWIGADDIDRILNQFNLKCNKDVIGANPALIPIVVDNIMSEFKSNNFVALYFTDREHFRVVVKKGDNNFLMLDSMVDKPSEIDVKNIENLAYQNMTKRTDGVRNRVVRVEHINPQIISSPLRRK